MYTPNLFFWRSSWKFCRAVLYDTLQYYNVLQYYYWNIQLTVLAGVIPTQGGGGLLPRDVELVVGAVPPERRLHDHLVQVQSIGKETSSYISISRKELCDFVQNHQPVIPENYLSKNLSKTGGFTLILSHERSEHIIKKSDVSYKARSLFFFP